MTNKEMLEEKIAIRIGIFLGELKEAFQFFGLVLCIILSLFFTGVIFFGVQI